MRAFLLASLLLALFEVACAAPTAPTPAGNEFKIHWSSCSPNMPSNLDCGQLQVPLDWSQPSGKQIMLGMKRVKANSTTRIGNLIFNPGGPGGVATEFCQYQAAGFEVFSKESSAHFDIICPDPRGIGTSTPVLCDPDLWNQRQSVFPKDVKDFEEMVKINKAFGKSCLDRTGDLLRHVDTTSVVRDLEAIRIALNDGKLNWLGESYGTQIGAQYAELFPENIRAMVLDGNVDHSAPEIYALTAESSTYENEHHVRPPWTERPSAYL
jgi:pimeloyl-ACP methyl ester carboxylesterase